MVEAAEVVGCGDFLDFLGEPGPNVGEFNGVGGEDDGGGMGFEGGDGAPVGESAPGVRGTGVVLLELGE